MVGLSEYIAIKRKNATAYKVLLSDIRDVEFLWEKDWTRSNFWFYTIKVPKEYKNPLIEHLLSRNIQVRPIWKLIHTLPMYKDYQTYVIHNAVEAYEGCINLPCSVNLKSEEIKLVVENIKAVLEEG